MEPRTITVYSIKLLSFASPKLIIECEVSAGTYIRSLARDIGEKLGTGAHLSALRRTQIGEYLVKDAVALEDLRKKE
jgi:tRNA pseudouridine55 synthase